MPGTTFVPIRSLKREVELASAHILVFPSHFASKLIQLLQNVHYPSHLKRIRKCQNQHQFLICLKDAMDYEQVQTLIESLGIFKEEEWSIETVLVSALKPQNRMEYLEWKEYWPISFQIDLSQEIVLSPEEIKNALFWIKELEANPCTPGNRVLCVDVATQEKVAEATDEKDIHPLHHAIMAMIQKVSVIELNRRKGNPSCVPRYLCQGLDIYVLKEPCIMCCMALVHSRINRLFFKEAKGPQEGGGIMEYKIHEHKSLNHHYQVYKFSKE